MFLLAFCCYIRVLLLLHMFWYMPEGCRAAEGLARGGGNIAEGCHHGSLQSTRTLDPAAAVTACSARWHPK
ncbi:hypothetical protein COO60DRAFT_1520604 [Scenedesmus sp. NREL 46B-D3]|nr:hypothetical protein COO60DRAFT_1520604 [Scenedesmus sp. NREL 46B-D3]